MIGTSNKLITYLIEQDKDKKFELKEYREHRSLNANNYYWKLCTELANVLRKSKEEMHFDLLKKYGQCEMVSVVSTINVKPYFEYYEEAGESILNRKTFTHYKIYKPSHEMDSKEMSILIHGTVEECIEQDIETKTPEEIESLIRSWK